MTTGSESPSSGQKQSGYYTGRETQNYTYTDFTYVRRKRSGHVEEEEVGELNIVPYLDIIVNLIMFLLVVQATLVSLGLIDVTAPSYASLGPSDAQQNPEQQKKQLRLTVGIAREGFYIAASGGVLPGETEEGSGEITEEGVEKRPPTIPLLPDGNYNFAALKARLREIKDWIANEHTELETTGLYVAAEATTPYEVVVKTLDASRDDTRGDLFPAVAFTEIR
ncbi:MAG: biopolymer transporter ExbD [Deltaproteobacteria bacterium]|nr:biopolymer transporter ExbD [Deltaproteobacteria bacterium]